MTQPQRIQLSRRKGFNLQLESRALNGLEAVNCARPSKWGNPFFLDGDGREVAVRQKAVDQYELWLDGSLPGQAIKEAARAELRGKNLGCWCKVPPCHVVVLLRVANE